MKAIAVTPGKKNSWSCEKLSGGAKDPIKIFCEVAEHSSWGTR
jgi:hypothetical protein